MIDTVILCYFVAFRVTLAKPEFMTDVLLMPLKLVLSAYCTATVFSYFKLN